MDAERSAKPMGRPRGFCAESALAEALRVFWTKGYDGASLSELTAAMGINRPSLYHAFGNKEALFRQALDLYERQNMSFVDAALAGSTARDVAALLLEGALALHTGHAAKGCLYVMHSVGCGAEADPAKREVTRRRAETESALVVRFKQARADGDLQDGIDPEALARYLLAVVQGMAVQAGSGVPRRELERLVALTLRVWPSR